MGLLTAQQRQVDEIALPLLDEPAVVAAREQGRRLWAAMPQARLPAGRANLDGAVDEAVYLAVRSIAARVPSTPTLIWTSGPGYSWGDRKVPGSRWGGDNPDRIYRSFAVAPGGSYLIRGRRDPHPSDTDFSFEVLPTATLGPNPLAALTGRDVDVAADGTFAVTADDRPTAPGQRNHLALGAGARTVLVRDTLADWTIQTPNHLSITRTDSNATTISPPAADLAALAADEVVRVIKVNAGFVTAAAANPVNSGVTNVRRAKDGVAGTVGAWAPFHLERDQALIFTVAPDTASYISIQLTDPWFRSVPYGDHTSSLSNRQTEPNPDGSVSFIASLTDPGYANWLDPAGRTDGIYLLRVENFTTPPTDPTGILATPKLTTIAAPPTVLAPGIPRIDAAERAKRLTDRQAGYQRRFRA